jgi:hypothetical protein
MSNACTDATKFGNSVTLHKSKSISVISGDTEFYIDPVSRRLSARWSIDPSHAETLYMTYGCDPDGYRVDRLHASGKSLFLSCRSLRASVDSDIGPVCAWFEQAYGERYLDSIHWHVRQQDIEYEVKLEFTPWFSLRRYLRRVKTDGRGARHPDGSQRDEWWLSFSIPGEKYEYFSEVQQRPAVDEAGSYNG